MEEEEEEEEERRSRGKDGEMNTIGLDLSNELNTETWICKHGIRWRRWSAGTGKDGETNNVDLDLSNPTPTSILPNLHQIRPL